MTLATRCHNCGTVFRVVQDQLKISEGWVRCGRCETVFNALEHLFDLERDSPPAWQPPGGAPTDSVPADEAPRGPAAPVTATWQMPPSSTAPANTAPSAVLVRRSADEPPATASTVAEAPADDLGSPAPDHGASTVTAFASSTRLSDEVSADFLRHAERRAVWRQPKVRAALAAMALASAALLALQAGLHWRDTLAARSPVFQVLLSGACGVLGCRIEPLRHLEGLVVDSSGLTRLESGNVYRLSLVLRNRDTVEILLPAVDLTLTDGDGTVVSRKVIAADQLNAARKTIAPNSELGLQALLDPGERRLSGYTIDIFYP